jgi:hypothetical protein
MTRELCQADFLFPGLRYQQVCWEQPLVPTSRNAARQQRREVGPPSLANRRRLTPGNQPFILITCLTLPSAAVCVVVCTRRRVGNRVSETSYQPTRGKPGGFSFFH